MAVTQSPVSNLSLPLWSPLLDEHLEQVTRLNARIQTHPWTLKHWWSSQLPNYRNWVILNPQPIAYISLLIAADSAELMNIGVAPEHQSQGLGRALIASSFSLLPDQVVQIYLEVRKSNRAARSLYESMGFCMLAKRANYYPMDDGQREPAMVYSLVNDGLPIKNIDFYQESGKLEVVQMHFPQGKGEAK